MQIICILGKPLSCIEGHHPPWQPFCMDATVHKQQVGHRLRMAIEALHLKPAAVAREFEVSQSKLGNWFRGDNYPDEFFIFQFCKHYQISADWIYLGRLSGMAGSLADDPTYGGRSGHLRNKSRHGGARQTTPRNHGQAFHSRAPYRKVATGVPFLRT